MDDVETAAEAIEAGKLVILPTDTVYGLVCTAFSEQAAVDLYALKGRDGVQPTALVAASVDTLLELIPEILRRSELIARAMFPGPYTLILPNPAQRFRWLTGGSPDTIGVRVPTLEPPSRFVLDRVGAIVASSANAPGGTDPRRLDEVPVAMRAGVAVSLDGGTLPGTPSTVIDVTGADPVVLRDGAGNVPTAFDRIAKALTQSLPPDDGLLTPRA